MHSSRVRVCFPGNREHCLWQNDLVNPLTPRAQYIYVNAQFQATWKVLGTVVQQLRETQQLFERFDEFLRSAHAKLFSTQRFTESSQNRGRRSAATRHSAPGRSPVPRLTGSVRGVESWAAVFSCWKFLLVLTEHLKTHNEGMEESLKKNLIWQHTIKAQSKEKRKIRT